MLTKTAINLKPIQLHSSCCTFFKEDAHWNKYVPFLTPLVKVIFLPNVAMVPHCGVVSSPWQVKLSQLGFEQLFYILFTNK